MWGDKVHSSLEATFSAPMDWQVFIAAYLCMICITERNAGFASLKSRLNSYIKTYADDPVNTIFKKSYIGY